MIAVIDYGLSNLYSLSNALKFIGIPFYTAKTPEEAGMAGGIILPGVGAFPEGMRLLKNSGMYDFLKGVHKPVLGICLGMQLLFDAGEEFSLTEGLGLIGGRVTKITGENLKIPHMGWNSLKIEKQSPLFEGIEDGTYVYFVHSYKAESECGSLLASSRYGDNIICAAAGKGNVFGTQFHPEKSGEAGLKILKNFAALCGE